VDVENISARYEDNTLVIFAPFDEHTPGFRRSIEIEK
jgi:hypothetical protein